MTSVVSVTVKTAGLKATGAHGEMEQIDRTMCHPGWYLQTSKLVKYLQWMSSVGLLEIDWYGSPEEVC